MSQSLKLYTRTVCPKCMLIKTLLNDANIPYEIVNLDFDEVALAEIQEQGIMALPVAKDGETYYSDIPAIQNLINFKKQLL